MISDHEQQNLGQPTQTAAEGFGPLLQRDYCAVIEDSTCTPEQVMEMVRAEFPRFSPEELAAFDYADGSSGPLDVGSEMDIQIKGAGECRVRVVHNDEHSFTLRTLDGHPEAGRITFGAHRDAKGHLVFRIRSRARASDKLKYIGYIFLGQDMQEQSWVTFIERVAAACGGRIPGTVEVQTERVNSTLADQGEVHTPTFVPGGGK